MRNMSVAKLAKVAIKISKSVNKAPLYWFSQNSDVYTVFTPYFAIRFSGAEMFNEICAKVGFENMQEYTGSDMIKNIDKMFVDLEDECLIDPGVLGEDGRGLLRFLHNSKRIVAVNEAYYEIFNPLTIYASRSAYGPAVLACHDCMAAILPVRAQSKPCVASLKTIAKLYS